MDILLPNGRQCYWCGKSNPQVVAPDQPLRVVVYNPCNRCATDFEIGVACMEVVAEPQKLGHVAIIPGAYPTGRVLVITDEVAAKFLIEEFDPIAAAVVLKKRKCFLLPDGFERLIGFIGGAVSEDTTRDDQPTDKDAPSTNPMDRFPVSLLKDAIAAFIVLDHVLTGWNFYACSANGKQLSNGHMWGDVYHLADGGVSGVRFDVSTGDVTLIDDSKESVKARWARPETLTALEIFKDVSKRAHLFWDEETPS